MSAAWQRRIWIIDGHNVIFGVPHLGRLQERGAGRAARRGLETWLAPFARQLVAPLTIVYDGNRMAANPDASTGPDLRTVYSQPPEEADDRILFLAGRALQGGAHVTVVSNDRRSLGARLPEGVRLLGVEAFRRRWIDPPSARDAETEGDELRAADISLDDDARREIAARILERSADAEAEARRRGRQLAREAQARWAARGREHLERGDEARRRPAPGSRSSPGGYSGAPASPAPAPAAREQAARGAAAAGPAPDAPRAPVSSESDARARAAKRERGRRKQARRLAARRRGNGGGKRGRR